MDVAQGIIFAFKSSTKCLKVVGQIKIKENPIE
jgi:hypothetical protein